jgi:hypothetical protein
VIKFANVTVNVGDGFNKSDSVFTAPVRGIYEFGLWFHVIQNLTESMSETLNQRSAFGIAAGQDKKPRALSWGNHNVDVDLATTEVLNKGDRVVAVLHGYAASRPRWTSVEEDPLGEVPSQFWGALIAPLD